MIEVDSRPLTAFAEDAVQATAYMATALLNRGELLLPPRIREHLADGPVVVHLLRGEDDVARYEATLTATSKLVGIEWPADVKPKSRLTVLCPRGGASHDIGVVLPELNVDWPDDDLPPTPDPVPAAEPKEEPAEDDETPTSLTDIDALAALLADEISADRHPVETPLPGPAKYEVPTTLRLAAAPTETIAAVPADGWPADEPDVEDDDEIAAVAGEQADVWDALDASEETAIVPAVGTLPPFKVAVTRAWSAFRRRLTPRRTVLLTAVVAIVVTWAAAWVVMG